MADDPREIWAKHSKRLSEFAKELRLIELRDSLAAGDLASVGRIRGDIEFIPSQFWISPKNIIFSDDKAYDHECEFRDIKCFWRRSHERQSEHGRAQSKPAATVLKVPAHKQLRPEIIADCYHRNLIDFNSSNLAQRHNIYIAEIERRYPACDTNARGLGVKSWEADETSFKKSKGLVPNN